MAATNELHWTSAPVRDVASAAIASATESSSDGLPSAASAAAPTLRGSVTATARVLAVVPVKKSPVGAPSRSWPVPCIALTELASTPATWS